MTSHNKPACFGPCQFVWEADPSKWTDEQVYAMTEFVLRQQYGDDVAAIEAAKRQALIDAGAVVIDAESTAISRT